MKPMWTLLMTLLLLHESIANRYITNNNQNAIEYQSYVRHDGYIHHVNPNSKLYQVLSFLKSVQNVHKPGQEYGKIKIGIYAGFAAQFQMAAAEWMRALAAVNFSMPILIEGEITGYSNNPSCAADNYQFTCYFYPVSDYHHQLLQEGKEVPVKIGGFDPSLISYIPPRFQEYGASYWWAAIQYYLFRLKPAVMRHVLAQGQKMRHGLGFPYNLQHFIAGIHIRHGDKKQDGFREHQLSEELAIIRKCTNICQVVYDYKDNENHDDFQCFSKIHNNPSTVHGSSSSSVPLNRVNHGNHTENNHLNSIHRIMRHKIDIIYEFDLPEYIQYYQYHKYAHTTPFIHESNMSFKNNKYDYYFYRNTASNHSNTIVTPKITSSLHQRPVDSNCNHQLDVSCTSTNQNTSLLFPLQIFIASDDKAVVQMAHRHNYLVLNEGISHNTGATGMLVTLVQEKKTTSAGSNKGYNATLEVISDIFYLAHCSILVGICASQVFRMAVALSNVSGLLQCASTLDNDQIKLVKRLSDKYQVPFPENFYE